LTCLDILNKSVRRKEKMRSFFATIVFVLALSFLSVVPNASALEFYALEPCRIVDTRDPGGGGSLLGGISQSVRSFVVGYRCGVPGNAVAVAVNVTAVSPTGDGYLAVFPSGDPDPSTVPSTLNFSAYTNTANGAIVKLGDYGAVGVWAGFGAVNNVHIALDVSGYFR
jgi:hypothetical protein